MPAIPVPSSAGETTRWNNRNYIAVDDSGTLVWEQDHDTTRDNWYYIRDYADENSQGAGRLISNKGYYEFEDTVIQFFMSTLVVGNPTYTYTKPYINNGPYFGSSTNDVDQTDTEQITTLYGIGLTSTPYTTWNIVRLEGTCNANMVTIGEQTAPSVIEYDQLPAPNPLDECDHDGRHLWAAWDGVKWVWDWNYRAYAAVDNHLADEEKYFKFGNMLVNVAKPPGSPGGPKNLIWPVPYDSDVEPVIANSARTSGLKRGVMTYFLDGGPYDSPVGNGPLDHLGITYKQYTPGGAWSEAGVDEIAFGPIQYKYDPPLRWPVPNFLNEKFHYRGRDYVAVNEQGTLIWEMDPDALVRIATEHIVDGERLDLNDFRFIGGRTIVANGDRVTTFPFSGFGSIPTIGLAVDNGAGEYVNNKDWTANQSAEPTETEFTAIAWDYSFGNQPSVTSDIDYLAVGLAPATLLSKLIAGWTLDGSGSGDKVELLGSGYDFRSAGSAMSELAVKEYGAKQDSIVDPATDMWFNLETLAWHNSGEAWFDGTKDFGISFWFYPNSAGSGTVGALISMSDDGSPIEIIYDDDTGTTINLFLHDVDTSVQGSPTVACVVDQWNFLYFGWTASSKTISVILNDNARSSSVLTVAVPLEELDDGEPLTLFRYPGQTAPVRGILDELYFWNADLSDAEVARLYNNGEGVQGPNF